MVGKKYLLGIRNYFLDSKVWKPIAILSAVYIFGISAILRANFYYIDDMGRALWGYKEFLYFSRYIPQYFSTILHADTYLTDISPLPQLIAAVIMGFSAYIVLHFVTKRDKFTFMEYVSMIPLGLSPYFLECMSYKYDSPYMALSVLASVLPLLFLQRGYLCYFISVFIGMLTVCLSYQASSGIFPMLVAILALIQWNQGITWKDLLRFVLVSAAGFLAGMLFFAVVIMTPADDYASNSLPALFEMLPVIYRNFKEYYWNVFHDFKVEWLIMIALLCVGFVYTTVCNTKQNRFAAFFMSVAVLGALFVMAFGLYPILSRPTFDPRAMYGFGVMTCFVAIYTVSQRHSAPFKAVCFVLCWCFFVFGFTYGNALNAQKIYTDYRITAVIDDLDELGVLDTGKEKTYQITGKIGRAPEIEGMPQDYQILNRLVPITFGDSTWDWGRFGFSTYYRLRNIVWDNSIDLRDYDLPLLKKSLYHTIWGNDSYVLIEVKW